MDLKRILPHLLIFIGFIVVALLYFNPVLSGKKIFQSDIQQSQGMSRQKVDFRKEHHAETYWVDNAFGGMPTYLIGPKYKGNFIQALDKAIRFLPRPADYLFLYFIGLYILFLVFKIDYRLAAIGALVFGFSTYLIIIIGVGHNAKAHAIAYMPLVLAGVFAVFKNKYFWGGILLAVSLALEIYTGHFQITYYLLLMVLILGIVYFIEALKSKTLPHFFKSVGVMAVAVVLAVASNATNLLASKEYTAFSTRGDTGLSISRDGTPKPKTGLSFDYITEYSYGLAESLNLFIPRFTGGASTETLDSDSHAYKALIDVGASVDQATQFLKNTPTYWGEQPIVAAPNYIGAGIIFLFILALYLVKGKLKWWVAISSLLALLLSWGYHFEPLTRFFVNHVPLYDKFRTVSMIQVVLQLLIPFFGIYGLSVLFSEKVTKNEKMKALKKATLLTAGICVFLYLFKGILFNFSGAYDKQFIQNIGPDFVDALKKDRIAMLNADTLRSLAFVLLVAGCLYSFLREKLTQNLAIGLIGVLLVVDLVTVDRNYVNNEDFVPASQINRPFQANQADQQIMQDKGHFRVLDMSVNPMNSARTSYFHNSLGGYHAAKPGRMQELFDFYISQGKESILNMLNTKYFIVENQGEIVAHTNQNTYGNAWFVDHVLFVDSANDEMKALDTVDLKHTAIVNTEFKDLLAKTNFESNQEDSIELIHYQPNKLTYEYQLHADRLAVFSEIYYPHGWRVTVDGKPVEMVQANYVLRAVLLPEGSHTLRFEFDPKIVKTGSAITTATGILLGLLVLGGLFYDRRKGKENPKDLRIEKKK